MNLKYSLATGQLPSVHAAAMLLLVAFIVISLLLKRPFVHGYARLVRFQINPAISVTNCLVGNLSFPLAGYSSARREVFAVEFFSLYRVIDARSGDSLFYVVALQRGDGR